MAGQPRSGPGLGKAPGPLREAPGRARGREGVPVRQTCEGCAWGRCAVGQRAPAFPDVLTTAEGGDWGNAVVYAHFQQNHLAANAIRTERQKPPELVPFGCTNTPFCARDYFFSSCFTTIARGFRATTVYRETHASGNFLPRALSQRAPVGLAMGTLPMRMGFGEAPILQRGRRSFPMIEH